LSTQATGRVVDQNTGNGIPGLIVSLIDISMLWTNELGRLPNNVPNTTQSDGSFTIGPYAGPSSFDFSGSVSAARKLALEIRTSCYRLLWRKEQDDEDTLDFGAIALAATEVQGFAVTLGGTGTAQPVRTGNAIQPLVDDELAWGQVADAMVHATASIDLMQLEFDIPREFNAAPPQESPEIVLSFDRPIDALHLRTVLDATDYRPERLLIDKSSQGVRARVIMPVRSNDWKVLAADAIPALIAIIILAVTDIGNFWSVLCGPPRHGSLSDVDSYFKAASSTAEIKSFETGMFNVVHAKMVFIDAAPDTVQSAKLLVIGSPFSQSYFDATVNGHKIFDPRRGAATGEPVPVHDVSLAVRGPALKDAHDTFRQHWNRGAAATDQVPEIPVPATVTDASPTESMATLQLVRSINAGAFPELPDGEKGVLEAYLRAFENAQDLIYLENQYFTHELICKALVAALKNRSGLHIIVLFNVTPDIPFYPIWQSNWVERIKKDAGTAADRIEFFTAWSHDPPLPQAPFNKMKPMVMANYIHSKAAVVDDQWATVGSANLDGASLDAFQVLHPLQFGDNRNHEMNYIIQNDPQSKGAADAIRRALWSEHLGYDDVNADDLNYQNKANFLSLWTQKASTKLNELINSPSTINSSNGRVLKWPDKAKIGVWRSLLWPRWPFDSAERHILSSAGVKFDSLELIEHERPFSFHDGSFS
jgi:phosphatidylserine/phosphatidylglycerophosphate/cardiolipin synthase-like enzyme